MANLFQEFRLKDVVLRNRITVSPMCQSWPLLFSGLCQLSGSQG